MLFTAMACFSPSVPAFVRRAWVQNGGRLTHTDEDFRKADYFFCNGMDDPWLPKLRRYLLIVRHASWVMKSVSENFLMPIASFTLDANFDPSKVEPLMEVKAATPEQTILPSIPQEKASTSHSHPASSVKNPVRNNVKPLMEEKPALPEQIIQPSSAPPPKVPALPSSKPKGAKVSIGKRKPPTDTHEPTNLPRTRKQARIDRPSLAQAVAFASSITYKVMPPGRGDDWVSHSHSSVPSNVSHIPYIVFKKVPMKDRKLKRSGSFEAVVVHPSPAMKVRSQQHRMP
ncbi:hypothetical protein BDQ17DRAFT_835106 [Cyathus striatus]|nr:hypothetical protein BDQ17DRAFT_835106 [Cyathus striatus]